MWTYFQGAGQLDSVIGDRRSWNYAYSPSTDFIGPLKNSLPTFWCNKLSRAFASTGHGDESTIKPARQMPLSVKIQTAKELSDNNHSGVIYLTQGKKKLFNFGSFSLIKGQEAMMVKEGKKPTEYQKFLVAGILFQRVMERQFVGEVKTSIPDINTLPKYSPESLHYSPQ